MFLAISVLCLIGIVAVAVVVARNPGDGIPGKSALQVLTIAGNPPVAPGSPSVWGRSVTGVDPSGPAAQAALRVGDVILTQDGIPVAYASTLYADKRPGDSVVFGVWREEKIRSVVVTLSRPSARIALQGLAVPLVAAAFWFSGTLVLFLSSGWRRQVRLLFLYTQLAAGSLALGLISSYNVYWATALFNVSLALLSALLLHFHGVFPISSVLLERAVVLRGFYVVGILLALPAGGLLSSQTPPLWYPLWRSSVRVYFALAMIGSTGLLLHTYLATQEHRVRRQVRVIAQGTAGAFVPLISLIVLPQALTGHTLVQPGVALQSLTLIPVAYAVAVYKHDLLEIDRFLNRGVVYFSLGVLWLLGFLGVDLGLSTVPGLEPMRGVLEALISLLMALALVALRPKLQQWVDQAFYGSWYDYRSVIMGVSRALHEAQDEATLVTHLVDHIKSAMDLRGIALLLSGKSGEMALSSTQGSDDLALAATLPEEGSLASRLCREARPIHAADLKEMLAGQVLSGEEQAWLAQDAVRLWIPLVSKERIQGLLLLGDKANGEPFDTEDLRILETLGRQAAIVAENVQLVSSLQRRVLELEQLRDELEITHHRLLFSREEERKRLARELHDRLLQTFLGLNMDVDALFDLARTPQQMMHLMALEKGIRALASETRQICSELRPPALGIAGLAATIRSYTEQWAEQHPDVRVIGGFSDPVADRSQAPRTIKLDLARDRKRLPDEIEITLFRVYQEALANISRHAEARNVWVTERLTDDLIELVIGDDGGGFTLPARLDEMARLGHFGLLGIRERIAAVGGKARITSEPSQGTEIRVTVPLEKGERKWERRP